MISPTAGDIGIWTRTLLVHTYTRTPVTDGAEDAWGDSAQTPGSAVTGVACLYQESDQPRRGDSGLVTISVPTLYVAPDDSLVVGDQVSSIADRLGFSIKAGPFIVESIELDTQLGPTVFKRATLRAGDVR